MNPGSMARNPALPSLNQQHKEELTDSAGDSVGFTDVAFLSSGFFCVALSVAGKVLAFPGIHCP